MSHPVLIYMGTPAFAVAPLEALCAAGLAPALVYTQPDRPSGRGRRITPPPVAGAGRDLGLEVRQPEILQTRAERLFVESLKPDLILTAAYGKILKTRWLALARHGGVNLHPSLLPRYRGVNPIGRAIMRGEGWTGITTFRMDEGTDTGPILLQEMTPIGPDESMGELSERLSRMGGRVLVETVRRLLDGAIEPAVQDEALASYAAPFTVEERRLSWRRPARQVHDHVRALCPDPGAETARLGRRLKILAVRPVEESTPAVRPGAFEPWTGGPPRVRCSPGTVELLRVKPEGKPSMAGEAWRRGLRDASPGFEEEA